MSARFKLKAPLRPRLSEAHVTKQIIDLLEWGGYIPIRLHVGRFTPTRVAIQALDNLNRGVAYSIAKKQIFSNIVEIGEPGTPDWIALHPTEPPLWLELKAEGGKARPEQEAYLNYLRIRGFRAGVFSDIDEFRKYLQLTREK